MTRHIARHPVWLLPGSPPSFPDPRGFGEHGLVAGGGDLSPERLLLAYRSGIFPWYDDEPILWWSPDPRAVLEPGALHVSRSLARRLRSGEFRLSVDQDVAGVLDGCAERAEGTWLTTEMKLAYLRLAGLGHLKSYEVWHEGALVGGLYGVLVGGLFAAESKFHRRTDASKLALVAAATHLFSAGVTLFDVQFRTPHLERLGVAELGRAEYLERLSPAEGATLAFPRDADPNDLGPWLVARLGARRLPDSGG
jgi:leucyl/phenylalanyl-tRNA--protein transferase